jgi:hypothetical protein
MCLIMQIRFWGPSFESFRALPRTARKHTAFTILLGNAKALRREHRQHVSLFSGSKLATVRVPVHAPALVPNEIALLQLRSEQLLIHLARVPPNSRDAAAARKAIDQMTQSLMAAQRRSLAGAGKVKRTSSQDHKGQKGMTSQLVRSKISLGQRRVQSSTDRLARLF